MNFSYISNSIKQHSPNITDCFSYVYQAFNIIYSGEKKKSMTIARNKSKKNETKVKKHKAAEEIISGTEDKGEGGEKGYPRRRRNSGGSSVGSPLFTLYPYNNNVVSECKRIFIPNIFLKSIYP